MIKFSSNSKFKDSNIHRLSELKPAGTKLILEPNTDLIELLRLTLYDLALKQVLTIKKERKKLRPTSTKFRKCVTITMGKNFKKYNFSKFEKYFTKRIDDGNYVLLKVYLIGIYKEITLEYKYKKTIIRNSRISNLFKLGLTSFIFSTFKKKSKGKIVGLAIREYLNDVDKNIKKLIRTDPDKASELISFLNGNIFLLKNSDFRLFYKLKLTPVNTHNNKGPALFWTDFTDFSIPDLIQNTSKIFDSINTYLKSDTKNRWNKNSQNDNYIYGFDHGYDYGSDYSSGSDFS